MATAKQLRRAFDEAFKFSFESEPHDSVRRCACFVSFLSGWLRADEPSIAAELRRLLDLPALTDGA